MNKEHNYAFYGSLRKDQYNNQGERAGMKYQKTVEITGFKLFSLGAYPCVVETGDETDKLTVDLFNIDNPGTENSIHRMEIGAGYSYKNVEIDGKMFGIYVYPTSALTRLADRNVPDGDWVKFLQNRYVKSQ